ncbi:tyrosine-protein phosphatase [Paenibacillus ferrarius]|uniref:tyrosine-protein phosphatase n=1 Tax=Paenibacillus ferrarius TaxID=1469647 RepID=UPI003D288C83
MIDIHSHILPGLDDGAYDLDEALLMARQAVSCGIHTMIATPHHMNGRFYNSCVQIAQYVKTFQDQLDDCNIPLRVIAGQEIRIYPQLLEALNAGVLSSLGNSRYVLLELPPDRIPTVTEKIVKDLIQSNRVPIIAHPERNREIIESPDKLLKLVDHGALSQITAHSLLGSYGKTIMQLSLRMCRSGLAHFIASDAHDTARSGFALDKAYGVIQAKLGLDAVRSLQHNAWCVIQDVAITAENPVWVKPKWFRVWKAY